MFLLLTNKGDNKQLLISLDQIKLMEPAIDAEGNVVGTHIVLAPDMGRVVLESFGAIQMAMNVAIVKPV